MAHGKNCRLRSLGSSRAGRLPVVGKQFAQPRDGVRRHAGERLPRRQSAAARRWQAATPRELWLREGILANGEALGYLGQLGLKTTSLEMQDLNAGDFDLSR
jgi:hypothetical protein